jgi:hypothetical protein
MTEAEWLVGADPEALLKFSERATSRRKVLLFDIACCERVEHLFVDAQSRSSLVCVRRYADGRASDDELREASQEARWAYGFAIRKAGVARLGPEFDQRMRMLSTGPGLDGMVLEFDPAANAALAVHSAIDFPASAARCAAHAVELESGTEAGVRERSVQSALLRDIFGNPFRPVTFSPSWRTDTAVSLARQVYESRDFNTMPILADALQDAGCDNDDVLSHCRDANTTHVRGCWVVDLVLGKA